MDIWIWLAIIIVLSIIEAETISLYCIWFIISSIVSLVMSILGMDFVICFTVFVILGLLLLITTRKSVIKFLKVEKQSTNLDRIIGKKGIVTEDIDVNNIGEVKVDGKRWSAYANEELTVGSLVRILEIDSVKLKVTKWEE